MSNLPKTKYLSIHEAAKHLGLSTKTLRRWESSGKLVAVRTKGGHRRYLLADLVNMEEKKYVKPRKVYVKHLIAEKQVKSPVFVDGSKESYSTVNPLPYQAVDLYKPFALHPRQKQVLRAVGYAFFSFALLALISGTSEGLYKGYKVAREGVKETALRATSFLPLPSFIKTLAYSYQEELPQNTQIIAGRAQNVQVLALETGPNVPVFNVNILSSFNELADFVNGLTSSDVSTGTLTATGAATIDSTLDVSGISTFGDDVSIAGDLTSPSATFNLLNTGVTTLNIGGASTTTSISATTGTTTVNNDLNVKGKTTLSGALNVSGKITGSGDLAISGATALSGSLSAGATTLSSLTVSGTSTLAAITGTTLNLTGLFTGVGITSSGDITFSSLDAGGFIYSDTDGTLNAIGAATPGLCLIATGAYTYSWGGCSAPWQKVNATDISTVVADDNLIIGGTTTSDAKFQVLGASGNVSTSGSISTTGTGTITSAGLLTASGGLTVVGGTANINVSGTNSTAIGNSTGTFALLSNGGLNVTIGGVLTGVASLNTITTTATAITFAGAGTIDSGSTNDLNVGTGNNAKTINVGTGTAGNTINIGTDNTTADAINIGSVLDTITLTGDVNLPGLSASSVVYTDVSKNLTTTAPTSGTIGYWSRTGTVLSPSTATDTVNLTPNVSSGTGTTAGLYLAANSLSSGNAVDITSTSTAGNAGKLFNLSRSGANGTSGVTNYGLYSTITNTGTTSSNVAGYFAASGATNNYGLVVPSGYVGVGTGTPAYQVDINASATSGTIFNFAYGTATTLTGDLVAAKFNVDDGNVIATNQNVTGLNIKLPTVTNDGAGSYALRGFYVDFGTGAGINTTGAGTTTYNAAEFVLPALTQTSGTLAVNGLAITTPTSITTGGTANGINISPTGVGAGNLRGLNIGTITGGGGTEYALNIGSGWDSVLQVNGVEVINGSGVTEEAGGGTGQSSYTQGDILYSSAANTLSKLAIGGTTGYVLKVGAGGVPEWGTVTGSSCTNCLINNPSSNQIISPVADATGLTVEQSNAGSPTADIFSITGNAGGTKYFYVDSSGVVHAPNLGSFGSDQLTIEPGADKFALKLLGTNVATNSLALLDSYNTGGNILDIDYPAATVLASTLVGIDMDISTNVTATNQSVYGSNIILPYPTNTHTTGTKYINGVTVTAGGGLNQNGVGGTTQFAGVDVTVPALTQSAGTINGYAVNLTTPSSITTGGTAAGVNINASGVGAGTLNGVNISGITAGGGTETAVNIGAGWDYGINSASLIQGSAGLTLTGATIINTTGTANTAIGNATGTFALTSSGGLNVTTSGALTGVASIDTITTTSTAITFAAGGTVGATSTGLNLQADGAIDVNIAGGSAATGCTIANASGDLTCTGNITGAATGTAGFWDRTGTTLSPATAGDAVTTSGNISTTSTGTITSAGLLTGSLGLTVTGATTSLNASSNFDTNINTGTSTGAISLGNALAGAISLSTGSTFGVTTTTSPQTFTSANITGATTSSSMVFTDAALTSGTLAYLTSSSVTTGKLLDIANTGNTWTGNGTTNGLANVTSSSTAGTGSASSILLNVRRSGTNANATHSAYGLYSTVTNTGTTSTNIGGYFSASGATNNYAAIFENGNVGIGTATPTEKLQISSGNILLDSNFYVGQSSTNGFLVDGTDLTSTVRGRNVAILIDSANAYADTKVFTVGKNSSDPDTATELFRIQENGNVGIGTTAPDAALEINHATGDSLRLTYGDTDGSATNYTDLSLSTTGALTFTGSAATLAASASAEKTFLTLTPGVVTLTAPTQVTSLMETAVLTGATIAANAATTVDKATTLSLTAPVDSTNATITADSALRILNVTSGAGTLTGQYGLYIDDLTAGATSDYGIYIAGADTYSLYTAAGSVGHTFEAGESLAIDAFTTDNTTTSGVFDLNVDTVTNGNIGLNLDYIVRDAAGALTGVYGARFNTTIDADAGSDHTAYGLYLNADNDDTGSTIYGLYVDADADGGGEGTEYAAAFMDGNVGIGDSSPSSLLEVGNGTDSLQVSSVGDLTFVDADGGASITGPAGGTLSLLSIGDLELKADNDTDDYIAFSTAANVPSIITLGTSDLTIAPDGGDTNITGTLDVSGHAAFGSGTAISTLDTVRISESYSGVGSDSTVTSLELSQTRTETLTADTTAYGIANNLTYAITENGFNGYGIAGYNSVTGGGALTFNYLMGAYNVASTTSTAVADQDNLFGSRNDAYLNSAGTLTTAYGAQGRAYNNNTGTLTNAIGLYGQAFTNSTGPITAAYGVRSLISETSTGAITTGYGFYSDCNDAATCYGLYVDAGDAEVTTDWGVFVTGEDKNYFSGNVGIGDTTPTALLETNTTAATYTNLANFAGRISLEDAAGLLVSPNIVVSTTAKTDVAGAKILPIITDNIAGIEATNYRGLYIPAPSGTGTFTNAYGLYVNPPTQGTTVNAAAYFGGNVGIGTTSPTSTLDVLTGVTSTQGVRVTANSLTNGDAFLVTSNSTAGTASGTSTTLRATRTGANAGATHTAYGVYSTVANTGTTSTNIAGYFSATGATNNYAGIFESGDVGIGTATPGTKLHTYLNTAGSSNTLRIQNADNTNTASHSVLDLLVGGTSGGDPKINFTGPSISAWAVGTDNSDSDKFKVSQSTSLGTNDFLTIGTDGTVTAGSTTGAAAINLNSGTGSQTHTSSVVTGTTTTSAFVFDATAITSGTGLYLTTDSIVGGKLAQLATTGNTLTTGTILDLSSSATSITTGAAIANGGTFTGSLFNVSATGVINSFTGNLGTIDWSPATASSATGNLFTINIGTNGTTTGDLFQIQDAGSDLFAVNESQITSSLPHQFTASGDVAIAYDLQFTNATASYVKSSASLYVVSGETFNSSNLVMRTYNLGNILLDTGSSSTGTGKVGIGPSVTPQGLLHVSNTNANSAGLIGKALAIFDQKETQDIITASASGTTKFAIASDGKVYIGDNTTLATSTALCWASTTRNGATVYQVGDCTGTPADIAEWYVAENDVLPGTAVAISTQEFNYQAKGTDPYTGVVIDMGTRTVNVLRKALVGDRVIGIISSGPFQTFGEDIKDAVDLSGRNDIKAVPLALAGRIPVLIDQSSEAIAAGDRLVVGNDGKMKKVQSTGTTIATALEAWNQAMNKSEIMVILDKDYYSDPSTLAENEPEEPLAADIVALVNTVFTASESGIIANLAEVNVTNLNVLGDTVLGDTVINGALNVGGLTLNDTDQSINAIGVLKIQDLALGNVEFMNGLVVFDTNGNATVQSITANKYKVAGTSAGVGSLTAGSTEIVVNTDQVTGDSLIFVTPITKTARVLSVTSKTNGVSFKVEVNSADSQDITFNWWIVDKE